MEFDVWIWLSVEWSSGVCCYVYCKVFDVDGLFDNL